MFSGSLVVTNIEYTAELADPSSPEFEAAAGKIEGEVNNVHSCRSRTHNPGAALKLNLLYFVKKVGPNVGFISVSQMALVSGRTFAGFM